MRGSVCRYPLAYGRLGPTETASPLAPALPAEPLDPADQALLDQLTADWWIACEFQLDRGGATCGAHATYWLTCRGCGTARAECVPCRASEAASWAMNPTRLVTCGTCGQGVLQRDWRLLVVITPIGARP